MNVYIESNFVLEHALEQEQCESCEQVIRLASAGSIRLVIPAFSLAEAHIALLRKIQERNKLIGELQRHLSELGRSRPYRETPGNLSELAGVLVRSEERERAGLERTVDQLLETADVIPLASDIFHQAGGIQTGLDMSAQDSIVLASIVSHLAETKPTESCHLNRNTKDFDDPNVRYILDEFGCKFFGGFDEGLRYVDLKLRAQGS
jgi:predicted nucleic acid-binding protein